MNGTNAAPKQTTMVVKQPSLVKAHYIYIYTHTIIAAGLSKNTDRQSILKQARLDPHGDVSTDNWLSLSSN